MRVLFTGGQGEPLLVDAIYAAHDVDGGLDELDNAEQTHAEEEAYLAADVGHERDLGDGGRLGDARVRERVIVDHNIDQVGRVARLEIGMIGEQALEVSVLCSKQNLSIKSENLFLDSIKKSNFLIQISISRCFYEKWLRIKVKLTLYI